jgi:hypothetical protein
VLAQHVARHVEIPAAAEHRFEARVLDLADVDRRVPRGEWSTYRSSRPILKAAYASRSGTEACSLGAGPTRSFLSIARSHLSLLRSSVPDYAVAAACLERDEIERRTLRGVAFAPGDRAQRDKARSKAHADIAVPANSM